MALTPSTLIVVGAILSGFLSILMYNVRRIRFYKLSEQMRGPLALPIIGNALHFIGNSQDFLNKVSHFAEVYPSPSRYWLGNRLWIFLYNADQFKIFFNSPGVLDKEESYDFLQGFLGTGLLIVPASTWKIHRKLLTPSFNTIVVDSFIPIFNSQSKILVQQLERELNGKQFDMHYYTSRCALDIICESAMGVSVNAQTENECRFMNALVRINQVSFLRMFQYWLHPNFIFKRTQYYKDQQEGVKYTQEFTEKVIQKRIEERANMNDERSNDAGAQQHQRKAFLDLVLELSHNETVYSNQELRDEVLNFIAGGADTSATADSLILLMLAMHPDIQEKVYEELCGIFGCNDSGEKPATKNDLHRMEYLERVIKETLRLFPATPFIARRVTEDLRMGDYTIPSGTSVGIGIMKVQRSEEYWPNPLKFDPDRFLPEEVAKRHPFSYIPFSAGPRNCIGRKFAMTSMKTLLSTVLRRYIIKKDDIVPIQDVRVTQEIILKSVDPVMLRIEKRSPNDKSM